MKKSKKCNLVSHTGLCLSQLIAISLLFTLLAKAAKPEKPPPEPEEIIIDLEGGFVENMGFIPAADAGLDFTNDPIRHMAVSIGQLGGVNPETGQVIINEGNLLPLVAQELDVTGNAFFYTNTYVSGNTYIYGVIYGSGEGITNVPSANITGSLTERPEIEQALHGVWETLDSSTADITTLQLVTDLLEQSVSDTNNPHQVTATQVGAYTAEDTDRVISNALVQAQSISYIATNHTGNISITGSVSVLNLQVASNISARIFYGDGSGLTNLSIANLSGSLVERPELQTALDTKADKVEVWNAMFQHAADITALELVATELQQASADTNNPHQVTAEQLRTLPVSGGSMFGHIDMSGMARIINLADPANDYDAVTRSYLEKRLNHILPQGDIEMGIYTNCPNH